MFQSGDKIKYFMPKYDNAPIQEAVFEIKIDPPLKVNTKKIEALHLKISDRYPEQRIQRTFETSLQPKDGTSETIDKGVAGYQFWSEDKKQVCRFGLDGFSFSRLKPYTDWESSFPEAMRLWGVYNQAFTPEKIIRVAVRFINVIEIPEVAFELSDYFNNPPQPPENLPQDVEGFLSRMTVRFEKDLSAIIALALQPIIRPGSVQILFDIDAHNNLHLSAKDTKILTKKFERLRNIKNKIFEESLTQKTKELFK